MAPLLPPCPTKEEYHRLVDLPGPWLPAVASLAERFGLPAPTAADHRPAGFVVFLLGDRVLKLTPPWWEEEVDAERIALAAVGGRLTAPVPAVAAEGLLDGWPWLLLTRLPGEPLGAAVRALAPGPRSSLCREVGAFLRGLHGLPPADFAGLPLRNGAFEAERRARAPAAQRRWGVPEAMAGELEEALAAAPPLATAPPVPVHADLHHMNLLVEDPARPRLSAVIDFGDAAVGPAEFDLAVPALFLARGEPAALDALLSGYGLPGGRADPALRRRLLLWMFLHPFGNMARFLLRDDGSRRGTLAEMERELLPPG